MVSERAGGPGGPGGPGEVAGALLLCGAEPRAVAPAARLLRERMLLNGAGAGWSVLVPERGPWARPEEGASVGRVVGRWAAALAVATPWPVLGLWWDAGGGGFLLTSGFRRAVGLRWRADGTVAGVPGGSAAADEVPHGEAVAPGAGERGFREREKEGEPLVLALAGRLGLDPVLDAELLEGLGAPDPEADAQARLRGLLAVLTRAGVALPAGLEPGAAAEALYEALRERAGTRRLERPGWREAVPARFDAAAGGRLAVWMPWSGSPRAVALAAAQFAAGLPVTLAGARRGRGGVVAAGALLAANGLVGVAHAVLRRRAG
ncbi:hypothetical protein [Streptomyces chilikensis]|uniref:hypothetical protein n=1 Tax=Streptomyces chilikensis TaxID=1194079 RepID=UPI00140CA1AC|nr:hypothetical protein [Streptomyces chilikensis]